MLLQILLCTVLPAICAGADAVASAENIAKVVAAGKTAATGDFADAQICFQQETLCRLQTDSGEIFAEAETRYGFEAFAEIGFFHTGNRCNIA